MYRYVRGRVTRRGADQVEMDSDTLYLLPDTTLVDHRDRRITWPLGQLKVGDSIMALAWRDPATRKLMVMQIGI
jgi:hypothetical protein